MDRSRSARLLIGALGILILLPSVAVALLGLAITMLMVQMSSPMGLLSVLQVVVALVALVATAHTAFRFHRDGTEALVALSPWTLGAMHAGAAMVGLGVLAAFVSPHFPLGYSGDHLQANLLGIPALLPYGLLLWFRQRSIPTGLAPAPADRRRELWGPCLVILFVMVSLAVMGPKPFDRDLWNTFANVQDDAWLRRQRMALWLIGTGAMQGIERAQAVALLGQPAESTRFGDGELAYPLGRGLGFFLVDDNWLLIRLDESGRVTDARVVAPD
jgi:hypothetical protein